MKKIHKVIETCNDCENCKLFKSDNSNYSSVSICTAVEGEEFVLVYSEAEKNVLNAYHHNIPNNCPLETYTNENND